MNYKKFLYFCPFLICCFFIGCGSGSYDLEKVRVEYEEKIPIKDSTRIVEEEEIREEVTEKTEEMESYIFIIQIGAFANENNFQVFFERAKSVLGEGVYYKYLNNLYKIRIGEYTNRAEGQKFLDYVKSLGFYDAFMLTIKR